MHDLYRLNRVVFKNFFVFQGLGRIIRGDKRSAIP